MFRLMLLFVLTLLLLIWMGWDIALKVDLVVWVAALAVYFWLQPPDDGSGFSGKDEDEEEPSQEIPKAA